MRGNAEANSEIPHFVRNKLRNPMESNTYEIRDCFAPLAMTTLWAFYGFIKRYIKKVKSPPQQSCGVFRHILINCED